MKINKEILRHGVFNIVKAQIINQNSHAIKEFMNDDRAMPCQPVSFITLFGYGMTELSLATVYCDVNKHLLDDAFFRHRQRDKIKK